MGVGPPGVGGRVRGERGVGDANEAAARPDCAAAGQRGGITGEAIFVQVKTVCAGDGAAHVSNVSVESRAFDEHVAGIRRDCTTGWGGVVRKVRSGDRAFNAAAASVVAAMAAASTSWPSVWANRVLLDRPDRPDRMDRMERGVVVFRAWENDRKYFSRDCVVIAW